MQAHSPTIQPNGAYDARSFASHELIDSIVFKGGRTPSAIGDTVPVQKQKSSFATNRYMSSGPWILDDKLFLRSGKAVTKHAYKNTSLISRANEGGRPDR